MKGKAKQRTAGKSNNATTNMVTMLKAVTFGLLATTVVLLLFSFVMCKKDVPFVLLNPFSAGLLMLGSFLSGYLAARRIRERGMMVGALCGLIIFSLLMLASFMSRFDVGLTALIKLIISVASGAIGGIIGVNAKFKRK
ncbi:TIGR04086 family membrane protein [Oscillospiraceae bacterium LTW-04]|nr:TIGR04086 family membrane protein [Oscillospiraceae bacterium MB24-C1]